MTAKASDFHVGQRVTGERWGKPPGTGTVTQLGRTTILWVRWDDSPLKGAAWAHAESLAPVTGKDG